MQRIRAILLFAAILAPLGASGARSRPQPAAQSPDPAGSIRSPQLIRKVAPEYPKKARKEHVEGVVRLHVVIGKDGVPRELTVITGDSLLAPAAIKAVQQWRYEPALLKGSPVEVDTTIDVNFQLNRKE